MQNTEYYCGRSLNIISSVFENSGESNNQYLQRPTQIFLENIVNTGDYHANIDENVLLHEFELVEVNNDEHLHQLQLHHDNVVILDSLHGSNETSQIYKTDTNLCSLSTFQAQIDKTEQCHLKYRTKTPPLLDYNINQSYRRLQDFHPKYEVLEEFRPDEQNSTIKLYSSKSKSFELSDSSWYSTANQNNESVHNNYYDLSFQYVPQIKNPSNSMEDVQYYGKSFSANYINRSASESAEIYSTYSRTHNMSELDNFNVLTNSRYLGMEPNADSSSSVILNKNIQRDCCFKRDSQHTTDGSKLLRKNDGTLSTETLTLSAGHGLKADIWFSCNVLNEEVGILPGLLVLQCLENNRIVYWNDIANMVLKQLLNVCASILYLSENESASFVEFNSMLVVPLQFNDSFISNIGLQISITHTDKTGNSEFCDGFYCTYLLNVILKSCSLILPSLLKKVLLVRNVKNASHDYKKSISCCDNYMIDEFTKNITSIISEIIDEPLISLQTLLAIQDGAHTAQRIRLLMNNFFTTERSRSPKIGSVFSYGKPRRGAHITTATVNDSIIQSKNNSEQHFLTTNQRELDEIYGTHQTTNRIPTEIDKRLYETSKLLKELQDSDKIVDNEHTINNSNTNMELERYNRAASTKSTSQSQHEIIIHKNNDEISQFLRDIEILVHND